MGSWTQGRKVLLSSDGFLAQVANTGALSLELNDPARTLVVPRPEHSVEAGGRGCP